MQAMSGEAARVGGAFWLRWVVGTLLGWAVGFGVSAAVFNAIGLTKDVFTTILGSGMTGAVLGAAAGTGAGIAQQRTLRPYLDRVRPWAWVTVLTSAIVYILPGVLSLQWGEGGEFLGYFVAWLALGLAQWWLVLRGQVAHSGWWVLSSVVGSFMSFVAAVAIAIGLLAPALGIQPNILGQGVVSGIVYTTIWATVFGLTYGIVSGTVMIGLLRRSTAASLSPAAGVRPSVASR